MIQAGLASLRSRLVRFLREQLSGDLVRGPADEKLAAGFRARQIHAVLRLTPLTVTANAVAALFICQAAWPDSNRWWLCLWALGVIACAAIGIPAYLRFRRTGGPITASPRALRRLIINASVLGLLWSLVPVFLLPGLDAERQLLLTMISVGMLCAGGFALATVPRGAIIYSQLQALGLLIGIIRDVNLHRFNLTVLLIFYASIVTATVMTSARTFAARLRAEAEADRQTQLVGLLLNDFEQDASDWLWETDARGRLRHVSVRLAEFFRRPAEELIGQSLVELIAASHLQPGVEELQSAEALQQRLRQHTPFRGLPVAVQVNGETCWWSLTGKPLFDGDRVVGWRGVGSDITRQRRSHLEMSHLANFDSLTGLANRHQFRMRLGQVQSARDRRVRPCAILFMDLDNFKHVNDSLGHEVGDLVLQAIAKRLQGIVRQGDMLSRLGGDEFALISWGAREPEEIADLALRLIAAAREPLRIGDLRVVMSASIGIALAPRDGIDPDGLLKAADLAMYAAKSAGRNTYRFFSREMDDRARYRLAIHHDLRDALSRDQLSLHFQPQVDLQSGWVTGFEVLLRWHHPQRGHVSPGEFIPVAEETGLIDPIGAWVLERACAEAVTWPHECRVCVNVSTMQFAGQGIVEVVHRALKRSGLPASRLELEITESVLMQDSAAAASVLRSLRSMGVRISLDDFGTGFSALAYLRTFPMDKLKIDRSFVQALETDSGAHAIVQAIIDLARALNLETTAEGVETPLQLSTLRAKGCKEVQGFLLASPMPQSDVGRYLRRGEARPPTYVH